MKCKNSSSHRKRGTDFTIVKSVFNSSILQPVYVLGSLDCFLCFCFSILFSTFLRVFLCVKCRPQQVIGNAWTLKRLEKEKMNIMKQHS